MSYSYFIAFLNLVFLLSKHTCGNRSPVNAMSQPIDDTYSNFVCKRA